MTKSMEDFMIGDHQFSTNKHVISTNCAQILTEFHPPSKTN